MENKDIEPRHMPVYRIKYRKDANPSIQTAYIEADTMGKAEFYAESYMYPARYKIIVIEADEVPQEMWDGLRKSGQVFRYE